MYMILYLYFILLTILIAKLKVKRNFYAHDVLQYVLQDGKKSIEISMQKYGWNFGTRYQPE